MNIHRMALTAAAKRHGHARVHLEDYPPRRFVMRGSKTLDAMSDPICPDCSKRFVKRVNCQGLGEWLMSFFYVYPFRCQLCGHRFDDRQWGVRYVSVKDDRREYDRIATSFPVSISGDNIETEGNVIDISMGGCTLSSDAELSRGMVMTLALQLSNELVPVIVEAAVIRNVRVNKAGAEFLRFQQNDREVLQLFIRGLLLEGQEDLATEDSRWQETRHT
jgi:hypothetical protein